jgi:hypothetical protein
MRSVRRLDRRAGRLLTALDALRGASEPELVENEAAEDVADGDHAVMPPLAFRRSRRT